MDTSPEQWRRVAVRSAMIERRPHALRDALVVRAFVALGDILPSDACVELAVASRDGGEPRRRVRRMWSVQRHAGGCYTFEVHLPEDVVDRAGELRVSVRPTENAQGIVVVADFEMSSCGEWGGYDACASAS
ncbi:MAG TPA: hypothetical protein VEA99_08520 [Gemmatimonadaceae bacterium]|nr:hypothetical protein [Gemmatimonadaceae bacterium]